MSVIYISGIQGGVGKSFVTFLTINTFINDNPIVIDTDTDNPNVFKAIVTKINDDGTYETKNNIEFITIDTDNVEGWEDIINVADKNRNRQIIVNSPARNKKAIEKFGSIFNDLMGAGIDVITLFVINDKQDSINHLGDYLDIINTRICVIKNQGEDANRKFEKFENCSYFQNGIPNVLLENSSKTIQNEIFNNRKLINEIQQDGRLGVRIITKKWLENNGDVIKKAVEIADYYKG